MQLRRPTTTLVRASAPRMVRPIALKPAGAVARPALAARAGPVGAVRGFASSSSASSASAAAASTSLANVPANYVEEEEDEEGFEDYSPEIPDALVDIGKDTFTSEVMAERIDDPVAYERIQAAIASGKDLSKDDQDLIASVMAEWAMERGAVNFAHWAAPLRGCTNLLKYDSFIDYDWSSNIAPKPITISFTGGRLFMNETDGSSFPNGGLRATHRAAAFMSWDRESPPFVRGDTLYIPSAFVSFTGDALDEKTPLLRSQRAVNEASKRLLKHLPNISKEDQARGIVCNVGWEQEFFLVDRESFDARPDLVAAGRSVLGAPPSKGQQTSTHYFAPMHARAKAVLEETQAKLLRVNVPFMVYHNEVAPAQHELSPMFRITNLAADHNILAMEVLKECARNQGMVALTHEKPFKAVNGSGKHLNWGLNLGASGKNLYTAGKSAKDQATFIAMVAILTRAVNLHGDMVRAAVASAGNDHRLGAHEAPPAIISLYLGELLGEHVDNIIQGGPLEGYGRATKDLSFGAPQIQTVATSVEDRNRTAPFPFCGNRFELRAMGSDGNISLPLTVVHAAVAESMDYLSAQLEKGTSLRDAVARMFKENQRILFNGNGYSKEWHEEAVRRGLPNYKQSVDSYHALSAPKAKELMKKTNILQPHEVDARVKLLFESHYETIMIEANVMRDMLQTGIVPAAAQDLKNYEGSAKILAGKRPEVYAEVAASTQALSDAIDAVPDADEVVKAKYAQDVIRPAMAKAREAADSAERLIEDQLYPFPKYHEMFYNPQQSTQDDR